MHNPIYEQLLHSSPLSREDELKLCQQYQSGDEEAYAKFLYANLRLVIGMSLFMKKRGAQVPTADLIQEGVFGLIVAMGKFDPTRGVRFASYAKAWIKKYLSKQRMQEGIVPVTRHRYSSRYRVKCADAFLSVHYGRSPTAPELADWMGVPLSYVEGARERLESVSLQEAISSQDEDDFSYEDVLYVDNHPSTDDALILQEDIESLQVALGGLGDRDRQILQMRYTEDRTLESIAHDLDLSRERVRQILEKNITTLRQKMNVSSKTTG